MCIFALSRFYHVIMKSKTETNNFRQTQSFCVYGLLCPLAMQVKYIGCTQSLFSRALQHKYGVTNEVNKKNLWFLVLRKQGLKPIPVIIKEFTGLDDARKFEKELIKKHHLTLYNKFTTFMSAFDYGRFSEGERVDDLPYFNEDREHCIFITINGIKYGYADINKPITKKTA